MQEVKLNLESDILLIKDLLAVKQKQEIVLGNILILSELYYNHPFPPEGVKMILLLTLEIFTV